MPEVRALAALGRIDEVNKVIEQSLATSSLFGSAGDVMRWATITLWTHGHRQAATAIAERAATWYRGRSPGDDMTWDRLNEARAVYMTGRRAEARLIVERIAATRPDGLPTDRSFDLYVKGFLGILAAEAEDRQEALRISEELGEIDRPYLFGAPSEQRAYIHAALGELEAAVDLLRSAFAQGRAYGPWVHIDPGLEPLRGYPPFEELIRPKG